MGLHESQSVTLEDPNHLSSLTSNEGFVSHVLNDSYTELSCRMSIVSLMVSLLTTNRQLVFCD